MMIAMSTPHAPRALGIVLALGLAGSTCAAVFARPTLSRGGLDATERTSGPIRFEDRQPGSGVAFVLDNATTPEKPVIDAVLGGVALLDFDGDGRLDLFFTNGARIPGLAKDDPRFWNRLYRSQGDGTFRDVAEAAGPGEGYSGARRPFDRRLATWRA
jgi:hypothetical protein